jgi:hypothetical protein
MATRNDDRALNLMESNPAIAYMLASNWVFHKPAVEWSMRSIRAQLKNKQKRILPWLGFEGTDRVNNILKKVIPQSISIPALLKLRGSLPEMEPKIFRILSHLPRINTAVLFIATDPCLSRIATPKLYEELCLRRSEDGKSRIAYELYGLKRMIQYCYPDRCGSLQLDTVESIRSLNRDYEES